MDIDELKKAVAAALLPPPIITVSEWAQEKRRLSPEAAATPGQWDNARAPHLIAPMDACSPLDPCQEVTLKFASQTGKTEVLLNVIGYIMDHDPAPTLAIQPNQKPMGEAFSKDRIAPMLRDTPALHGKVAKAKSRDSENTLFHKKFPGGHLTIGGANSPAGLASRPIRYLLCDEIDRWEVTKEGHALPLSRKRTQTFWNRKILKVSSPTYEGVGIDAEYQNSDQQYEWHLACPDCGGHQFPQFRHFSWPDGEPEKAVYACEHCGAAHSLDCEDKIKATGEWVQVKDEGTHSKAFWMNQWASPFACWLDTIKEFLSAKDNPEKLQVVVNTAFAETWTEEGESVDDDALISRREDYGKVPNGALVLVAAVDVQDDRFEMEVIGYGEHEESWGIEHRVIYGDPSQREIWEHLDAALLQRYDTEDGAKLAIASVAIDSGGHFTQQVYDFCKTRQTRRVFAIKGMAGEGRAIVSSPAPKRTGKNPRPVPLFTVGVDEAKKIVHHRLRISEPGPGYCHFPREYDEEYFAQLTAEKIVTRYVKGFPKREWVKTRARNEALDIRAYALAALYLLNPIWDALKRDKHEEEKPVRQAKRQIRQPRRRGNGFVNGWR